MVFLSGVLLVLLPGLAWMVGGPHALVRAHIWAAMAGPSLLLLIAATMPPGLTLYRRWPSQPLSDPRLSQIFSPARKSS